MREWNQKMANVFLAVIVSLLAMAWLVVPNALAAPSISGIQGTVSNAQAVTINGSGFGSTGPNIVIFDDFEKGTNGSAIMTGTGSAQVGQWNDIEGEQIPRYSTASTVSGSLAFRADMSTYWRELVEVLLPANTQKVFVSWWILIPSGTVVPGDGTQDKRNWKNVWLQGAGTGDDDLVLPTFLQGGYYINGNDGIYGKWISLDFQIGVWKHLWCWISADDKQVQYWELTSAGVVQRDNASGVPILKSGGAFERVHFNGYGRATSNSYPMFDDVYVAAGDAARARVEIGNKSSYAACTKLAVSTPTSWSDTKVVATVRQGVFNSGETAYVYVVDSSGSVNAQGYPVTIGGGGGGGNPQAPSGLIIVN